MRNLKRWHAWTAAGLTLLVLASVGVWWRWLRAVPPNWLNDYDVSARAPDPVAPGTVVGNTAPEGWSHLVIKSKPRVRPAEVPNVPPSLIGRDKTVEMVAWVFTVFVADVEREQQGSHTRYRLRAVGLGTGTNVNGRDTVLTAESAEQHGVKLNRIEKLVLERTIAVQQQSRVVVHGPSFALVDTPVTFRCDGSNLGVRFRYALLVDPATGRLDVLVWQLGGCADPARAVVLAPDTIDEAELIPDPAKFDVGVPTDDAFAVDRLPPHRAEVAVPVHLHGLAAQTRFTAEEAGTLETGLRKLVPPR